MYFSCLLVPNELFVGSRRSIESQGEAGAYSEKSLRELLGRQVVAVGQESFEDAFKAVRERWDAITQQAPVTYENDTMCCTSLT